MWHSAAVEDAMTKEYTDLILETMNDKFQQMLECFSVLDTKIDSVEERLTEKIEIVDAKLMGLSKRVDAVEKNLNDKIDAVEKNLNDKIDSVEKRLSSEIAEVRSDLADHRSNTEMHAPNRKRALKKVA